MFTAAPTLPAYVPPAVAAMSYAPQTEINGSMSSDPQPDRFVILAGVPFHGKTTSALTFPDPFVIDLDHKITRKGIPSAEFWNDAFVDSICPRKSPKNPANRKDAITMWIVDNARFLKDRTVIFDGLSAAETAFHQQTEDVEGIKANVGGGQLFGKKLTYFNGLFSLLAAVSKRVIVTCHLAPIYVKDERTGGDVATGKSRPLITGQFAERITGYASANILCQREAVYNAATGEHDLSYWWHLKPTSMYDSSLAFEGTYPSKIKADYKEFRKLWA